MTNHANTLVICAACFGWIAIKDLRPGETCSPACEGIARAAKAGSPIAQKKIERMKKKRAGPQQPTMGPTLFDVFGGGET